LGVRHDFSCFLPEQSSRFLAAQSEGISQNALRLCSSSPLRFAQNSAQRGTKIKD
jgi:hypothetical protein